jgi:hypothetical protein
VRNVEITSHFLPIDYIYITPQWVVPAVTFPLILFFVRLLSLAALPLGVPFFSGVPERPARFRLFTVQKNFLVIVLSGAIALTALSVISQCRIVDRIQAGAARELSYSWPLIEAAVQALLVPCALIFITIGVAFLRHRSEEESKYVIIPQGRLWLLSMAVVPSLLFFSEYLGLFYAPLVMAQRPNSHVVAQTTILSTVEFDGKVIFVLTHHTLFLKTENNKDTDIVISIPIEKIVSIQTPAPTPTPTPTPTPAPTPTPTPTRTPTPTPYPYPSLQLVPMPQFPQPPPTPTPAPSPTRTLRHQHRSQHNQTPRPQPKRTQPLGRDFSNPFSSGSGSVVA